MSKNKDRRKHEENMKNKRAVIPLGKRKPVKWSKGTKLTIALEDEIIEYIMDGTPPAIACVAAGLTRRTYYNWLEQGNPDNANATQPFINFIHACNVAEAQFVVDRCKRLKSLGDKDWVACVTNLERRFPEYFARRLPHADEGKAPTTININLQLGGNGQPKNQPVIEGKRFQVELPAHVTSD